MKTDEALNNTINIIRKKINPILQELYLPFIPLTVNYYVDNYVDKVWILMWKRYG